MKLIRWLLSNIILIVVVLAIAYTYVYWDNLTGEDTPAGKTIAWMSDEFEQVAGLLDYLKVTRDETETTEVADSAGSDQEPSTSSPQAVSEEIAMPDEVPVKQSAAPAMAESMSASASEPVSSDDVSASGSDSGANSYVTPEIEQSLSRMPDAAAADTAPAEEKPQTTREIWINARKSFHRRDFESAISAYEQLIAKNQDNFDAYGELGNVYFNQGKIDKAAESYYQAAAILVRLGQTQRASSLMGMLGRVDPDKAKQLQELIASVNS